MNYKRLIKFIPYFIGVFSILLIASVSNLIECIQYERDMAKVKYEYMTVSNEFISTSRKLDRAFIAMYVNKNEKYVEEFKQNFHVGETMRDFVTKNKDVGFTENDLAYVDKVIDLFVEVHTMEYDYILALNGKDKSFEFDADKYKLKSEELTLRLGLLSESYDENTKKIMKIASANTTKGIVILMFSEVLLVASLGYYLFVYYKIVREQ